MTVPNDLKLLYSKKLVGLETYFNEMINLYDKKKFPNVLLINGKKGIGKFTLTMHFMNYIFSNYETTPYNVQDKTINTNSIFYNSLLNKTSQDIILIKAEENKNIKIEEIRSLKSTIAHSSLSNKPRFTIIDDVEFLNNNSINALLKTLEEPALNNFFILINNQQSDLLETVSSRCSKTNIFLNSNKTNDVINYLIQDREIENLIDFKNDITPGMFLKFNEIYFKYKIDKNDNIFIKLNKLINGYKKEKDKSLINLTYFLVNHSFLDKIKTNKKDIEFLLKTKSSIIKIIDNFVQFNLNINSVLNSIRIKLNDA